MRNSQISSFLLWIDVYVIGFSYFEVAISIISGIILGLSFIIGAVIAIHLKLSFLLKSNNIAFAAGIFFSTVAFSLIDESVRESGVLMMIIGLSTGSIVFSMVYHVLNKPTSDLWPKHSSDGNNVKKMEKRLKVRRQRRKKAFLQK